MPVHLSLGWGVVVWHTKEKKMLEGQMEGDHSTATSFPCELSCLLSRLQKTQRPVDNLKPLASVGLKPLFFSIFFCAQHTGN